MNSLRLAFGFLTVLPLAPVGAARMGPARAYFPLVGLALGGILAGLDLVARQALPPLVVNALLVVALLVLTRAIHTEGFLDSCDGLFGGHDRARRLEILRDSHVGAFAVLGGAGLLLLKWSLITGAPDEERAAVLVLFPCISRFGMLATMEAFPYAREQGLGTAFENGRSRWQVVVAFATALAASGLLLGSAGFVLLGVAVVAALAMGRWVTGLLGGMTGDTYGAVNEAGEVVVLLTGIVLFHFAAGLFGAPLW
ncbi:MAG: adenosylcobinamide-GDP ribazoletransferase [Chloroflexi bacterium]|nr:adenosylcobinamide-GDP ribazoletransferase [Chloroflexota bacterium]